MHITQARQPGNSTLIQDRDKKCAHKSWAHPTYSVNTHGSFPE